MAKTKASEKGKATAPRRGSTSAPTNQATPQNQASPPPTDLDFEVSWSNFEKVKAHFQLSDSECHEVLVAHCGPNPSGKEFWKRFKTDSTKQVVPETAPGPAAPAAAPERTPQPAAAAPETTPRPAAPAAPEPEVPEPAAVEPPAKRARLRPMQVEDTCPDTQMECASDHDDADDDCDDESLVSTSKTSDDGPGGVPPGGAAVPDSPVIVLSAPTPETEPPRQQISEDDPIRRDLERELAEMEREMSRVPVPPNKPNPVEKVSKAPSFQRMESLETLFLGSHDLSGQASQVNPPRSLQPADLGSPPSTLGPSASQRESPNDDKLSEIVKAISFLQHALQEDWAKQLMGNLGYSLGGLVGSTEVDDARAGLPSSSRPGQVAAAASPASVPKPEPPAPRPTSAPPAPEPASAPPALKPASAPPAPEPASAPAPKPASALPAAEPASAPAPKPASAPPAAEPASAPPAADPASTPPAAPAASAAAPAPMPEPSATADPATPAESEVNSTTHRAAHARLTRKMAAMGEDFPNAAKLWSGSRKEKNDLLKAWLASGENIKVMETKLVIQKSQEGKLTRGRELLTISEMKARGFSQCKIDSLVRRGGEPDPDCPDDPESMRFWASVGGSYNDTDTTTVAMNSEGGVAAGAATMESMLGGGMDVSAPSSSSGPSLQALVGVMGSAPAASTAPAATPAPKAKAQAKAKSAAKKEPKTPEEWRKAASGQCKREITSCTTIAMELPPDNSLRASLLQMKTAFENLLDQLRDVADDDLESFFATCSQKVNECRIIRAQARAVASEMKKAAATASETSK